MEKLDIGNKKIFEYNNETRKTAYLNWQMYPRQPIHNMNVLAEGYKSAANYLIKECLDDNADRKADTLILPILFCINQGIELYEKALWMSLNILLGYNPEYTENHDIRGKWFEVKNKIKKFGFETLGSDEKEFNSMIIPLEKYIAEVMDKINRDGDINKAYFNIDFSRYPLNNRKQAQFYVEKAENSVVDIEYLNIMVKDLFKCLDSLSGYYYELVLNKWDSARE